MKTVIAILLSLPLIASCASIVTQTAAVPGDDGDFAAHHSVQGVGSAYFRMMDTDEDGAVTRGERDAMPHQDWMADFDDVDLNKDGTLSEAEYIKTLAEIHTAAQEI